MIKVSRNVSAASMYKDLKGSQTPRTDVQQANGGSQQKKSKKKDKRKQDKITDAKLNSLDDKSKKIKKKSMVKQLAEKIHNVVKDQKALPVIPTIKKSTATTISKSRMPPELVNDDDPGHYEHQRLLIQSHLEPKLPASMFDSREHGKRALHWLIYPTKLGQFFSNIWEKKPLLIKRKKTDYFKGLFSCKEFDDILRHHTLLFNKNIDVTSYRNDKRETHNPDGRAYAPIIWDFFEQGNSIRLLNPQTFSRSVWKLLAMLQEFFGSFVGANVYLTPRGTQGFAPHFDDIEAFVVQLEGKKHWKVYAPMNSNQELPNYSSTNFSREDLKGHRPLIECELEPGDVLYFPRGWIHEASADESIHSLHITISTFQRNTFGDLFEKLLPQALRNATESDIQFRQSLPLDYLSYMGVVNQEMNNPKRDEFLQTVRHLMEKLVMHIQVDAAADQMGKKFIHDSLPPVLTEFEKHDSIYAGGERWNGKTNQVENQVEIEPDTAIKLIRYGMVRVVMEEETIRLYHSAENSREYHEYEPQYIEIGADVAPAVDFLLNIYPEYVTVDELPLQTLDDKMDIANLLYDKGLITIVDPEQENQSCDISDEESSQEEATHNDVLI